MPRKKAQTDERLEFFEERLRKLATQVAKLETRSSRDEEKIKEMSRSLLTAKGRQEVVMEALDLGAKSKKGDRGFLSEISESILHLEEYFLRNAERIDNILVTLKNHRELLAKMNQAFFKSGERDRIKIELDIMRNTLSILALAGTDLDITLVKEIKTVQENLATGRIDLVELRRSKEQLDRKFDGELKRFDLEALYLKRKNIPGYV